MLRADGKGAVGGWPTSARIEELRAAWLDTADFDASASLCRSSSGKRCRSFRWASNWQAMAYRKNLTDVVPGCFAAFFGVRRA